MATPQVIPGIFLKESRLELVSHLDLPHLSAISSPTQPTDFGLIDLWAFKRKNEVPLLAMNLDGASIQYIPGDTYTFELATASDMSTYIVEDISGSATPGIDGEEFQIKVNNNKLGGYGSRLKFDLTSPIELEVTTKQIKPQGEHYIYWVKMVPSFNGEKYVPKHYLTNGSKLYKLAATRSAEFGQNYDSWAVGGSSRKKFINFVSTGEFQSSYHITRQAAKFSNGKHFDKAWVDSTKNKVMQYVQLNGVADNGIRFFDDFVKLNPLEAKNASIGLSYIASLYDDITIGILAQMCSNYLMWGSGGTSGNDGMDSQLLAPGLWFQLDYSGYKRFFTIENFSKGVLIDAVRDYYIGKQDILIGQEPKLTIRTGRGGFELISTIFSAELNSVNMVMNAKDYGVVTGTVQNLTINQPLVQTFRINFIAEFNVVYDPSLDFTEANDLINPYVGGGYRLSSYSMIIHDYNEFGGSDNIKVLRPSDIGAGQVKMYVQNGTEAHPMTMMNKNGMQMHQSANHTTGYGAYFSTVPDTVWVKDPTRLLKLVPRNPKTFGSL
jgi:hypothetical protein